MPCADYPLTKERWGRKSAFVADGTQVEPLLYTFCSSGWLVCELKNGELLMDTLTAGRCLVVALRQNHQETDRSRVPISQARCRVRHRWD